MSTANSDGRSKPAPEVSPAPRANLRRRGFLLTLGVGGAGAAAVAVRGLSTPAAMNVAVETVSCFEAECPEIPSGIVEHEEAEERIG